MSDSQSPLTPMDYRDVKGIQHRVLVPADGSIPVEEGIPISLDIRPLFGHMPASFTAALTDALWSRGLIEPEDYLKPGAAETARSALLGVVKHDALDLVTLAKQESLK